MRRDKITPPWTPAKIGASATRKRDQIIGRRQTLLSFTWHDDLQLPSPSILGLAGLDSATSAAPDLGACFSLFCLVIVGELLAEGWEGSGAGRVQSGHGDRYLRLHPCRFLRPVVRPLQAPLSRGLPLRLSLAIAVWMDLPSFTYVQAVEK